MPHCANVCRLVFCAVFSASIFKFLTKAGPPLTSSRSSKPAGTQTHNVICPLTNLANDVLVVLRTGATESREKVPVHFRTTLQCTPHFIVVSDYDETLEGVQLQNVLGGITEATKRTHPDFKLYHHLQEHGREGLPHRKATTSLSGSFTGDYLQTDNDGWKLDKWKFLPMIDHAYKHKPEAKWFVFIEADTYLNWSNLLEYLGKFDTSKPYYIGKHLYIDGVQFGYGGAGLILSNSAMRKVIERRSKHITEYEDFTKSHWVGDCALGKVLVDVDVSLHRAFPHLQGDSPATLDPGVTKIDRDLWCYAMITYHRVSPAEIEELWQFEQEWYKRHNIVLRHRDIFMEFVRPKISSSVTAWDNISGGEFYNAYDQVTSENEFERNAWKSFEHCRVLCDDRKDCIQFSFDTGSCAISTKFTLGYARSNERIRSGWMLERVDDLFRGLDDACGVRDWFAPDMDERSELRMRRKRVI
jgi:hypothetical protein